VTSAVIGPGARFCLLPWVRAFWSYAGKMAWLRCASSRRVNHAVRRHDWASASWIGSAFCGEYPPCVDGLFWRWRRGPTCWAPRPPCAAVVNFWSAAAGWVVRPSKFPARPG
jgi:hypothetical protein